MTSKVPPVTKESTVYNMCLTLRHDFGLESGPDFEIGRMTPTEKQILHTMMGQIYDAYIEPLQTENKKLKLENKELFSYSEKQAITFHDALDEIERPRSFTDHPQGVEPRSLTQARKFGIGSGVTPVVIDLSVAGISDRFKEIFRYFPYEIIFLNGMPDPEFMDILLETGHKVSFLHFREHVPEGAIWL